MMTETEIKKLMAAADRNLLVNTSYPVYPEGFACYRSTKDLFQDTDALGVYLHVPFCPQRCSFCEYTRFLHNGDEETYYLSLLEEQVQTFLSSHRIRLLYGLDIGGGTPTVLSDDAFDRLMILKDRICQLAETTVPGFRKSIEGSFTTLTDRKLETMAAHGFHRLSVGLQICSEVLLERTGRDNGSMEHMLHVRQMAASSGICRFNVDLMYGLPDLTEQDISRTISVITLLFPDEVTLYETRFNQNFQSHAGITRDLQYTQYSQYFDLLTKAGYHSVFGRNTFSRFPGEMGMSSYLESRMLDGIAYKGFGISAQSMSPLGLSYGMCKDASVARMPGIRALYEEYNYALPPEEIAAKYVSIALYSGSFRLSALQRILKADPLRFYDPQFSFLFDHDLAKECKDGDTVLLTRTGFRYYGAVGALFWSKDQKKRLLEEMESPKN